jgi:predicted enzyme related to lactoylglutathione lyase
MLDTHGITGIVFFVRDLDRTRDFWQDALGIDVEIRGEGDDRWMYGEAGKTGIVFFQTADPQPPIPVFGLDDGGIEAVVAKLAERNVQIVTPVSHAPGGWTADFTDPDGTLLSLYQSSDRPK